MTKTHAALADLRVAEDCLLIGGVPVTELAARIGRTPFYAYDRGAITERVTSLRAVLPEAIELHYAVKANPMPAVVQHLAGLVNGLDVASAGELRVALDTTMPPREISFAGPGKRPDELAQAVAAGIVVNLESEHEMRTLARIGSEQGRRPAVAIRVNPDFELKASGMKMSGGPKAFGVDAERVPAMLRELGELDLEFIGFHIFTGSQNLRAESLIEAQARTFELAYRLADDAPAPVRTLNIGGGFGIPYFPGDLRLDLEPVGVHLAERVAESRVRLPAAQVVLELGRYLVGEAGYYVCRIVDRKDSRGEVFLVTDGGLHHHLAASGNFGQVVRRNYPVLVGNRVRGTVRETVNVVGPLCTPLDVLANGLEMARAGVGDLIVVLQSGAYGLTASPTAFLSHPSPVEVLV
jgi:diaminopimelate decarboxylase